MIQPLKTFKALDNASEMIVLKEWLEYLKRINISAMWTS